jgi:hypothetical protein
MIENDGLTKQLGGRTVVSDVTFRCEPGTVTGFLGPNGAGRRVLSAESARPGAVNGDAGLLVGVRADGLVFSRYAENRWSTLTAPVRAGEWQHVAAAYDGQTMRLFVNGQLRASGPSVVELPDRPASFTVGVKEGLWRFFAGGLDEAAVYRRALPGERVDAHYRTGLGR